MSVSRAPPPKGALIGMARTLAVGLGSDGIAVTAVAPGLTRTPATVVVPPAEFADAESHQALRRPLSPDDTAAVVAMLARDDGAALTGQTLTVDGDLVMCRGGTGPQRLPRTHDFRRTAPAEVAISPQV